MLKEELDKYDSYTTAKDRALHLTVLVRIVMYMYTDEYSDLKLTRAMQLYWHICGPRFDIQ